MRPVNVGSLLRTADAFGVKKIIFGGSPIELNKKTWNASRATENAVDFKQVEDTVCEIKNYKEAGYRVIALEITDEALHQKIESYFWKPVYRRYKRTAF